MFSILSKLDVCGSDPESESDHCWVEIINEVTCNGFFVLTACCKCGMLAKKLNSTAWQINKPSSDRWQMNSLAVAECPGTLEEIDY